MTPLAGRGVTRANVSIAGAFQNCLGGLGHMRSSTNKFISFRKGTRQCRCPTSMILAPAVATALPSVPGAIALAHFATLVFELACATQATAVAIALRLLNEPGLRLRSRRQKGSRCW